jgi:exosome complex RNA-binding protein Csl4
MDFFKFTHPTKTNLTLGAPINGYLSAMWVERYRTPGEFEFEAPMSSGLKDDLPLGTIISHVDTYDFAIVENHEISEDPNSDPRIKITGRTFDSWLENRMVGANLAYGTPAAPFVEFTLASNRTWTQAVSLINQHIQIASTVDDDDSLNDDILAFTPLSGAGVTEARVVKRGNLHERLLELLAVEDLGIRMVRKNTIGTIGSATVSRFHIHRGIDRSNSIIFSSANGDVDSAQYLWSIKSKKNAALVQGRYVETMVVSGASGLNRRMMMVDASDIDGSLSAAPTGSTLTTIRAKMQLRGQEALANQNEINIAQVDISKAVLSRFRKDYDIGDIISVDGNYGVLEKRRVVEYVEIEDENGESGHPTLAVLGE